MVLDFLPAYSTWDEWNGNLLHYFGEQQFPCLPEIRWQEVARAVTVNPVFDKYAVAAPETFQRWQDWAIALTAAINGDGA
jgi:hypothetical protein